jgi:hypothetical protein
MRGYTKCENHCWLVPGFGQFWLLSISTISFKFWGKKINIKIGTWNQPKTKNCNQNQEPAFN